MSRQVKYNQEIDGSLTMNDTQDSSGGVIFKGSNQFIHNFHHPTGGGALPVGQNTFIGESAGNFTMGATATDVNESSNNVAIGFESFEANTLGAFNIALGTRTLEANTEGSQNVALGHSALRNNTTGNNNTAIGYYSMFNSTTASQNVGVGYRTLEDNTGTNNIAIGHGSLQELSSGSYNTAVGMNAGRYITGGVNPNETCSNGVYIGYDTQASASGNTYEMVLGYNVTGNGSNTIKIGDSNYNDTYLFGQLHTENYSLPITDGTDGQVLTTDGLGGVTWEDNNSGAFASDGTTITEAGAEYDVDFVVGSPQLDDDGNSAHDIRMFFDKGKAAFRAGQVVTTEWNNVNLGIGSVAFGQFTKASGDNSSAFGQSTIASGTGSLASGGSNTESSGAYSVAHGISVDSIGDYSFARGYGAQSYLRSMESHASYYLSGGVGTTQYSNLHAIKETTNNTTSELTLDGNSASSANRLIIPASRTWGFKILVSARQTGGGTGTVGDSHIFKVEGGIKRDGSNNTSMIGTAAVSTIVNDAAASAWTVAVAADDTNESLQINVTGETDKTIHWSAKVELVEVG